MKFKCGWWCTLSLKYTHIAWYGMHPGPSVGFQNWGGAHWGSRAQNRYLAPWTIPILTLVIGFSSSRYLEIRNIIAQITLEVPFFSIFMLLIFHIFEKNLFFTIWEILPCLLLHLCNTTWVHLGPSYPLESEVNHLSNLSIYNRDQDLSGQKRSAYEKFFSIFKKNFCFIFLCLTQNRNMCDELLNLRHLNWNS